MDALSILVHIDRVRPRLGHYTLTPVPGGWTWSWVKDGEGFRPAVPSPDLPAVLRAVEKDLIHHHTRSLARPALAQVRAMLAEHDITPAAAPLPAGAAA
ncbi:hypothetical protein V6N00_12615 [Tersicoccus sp. MR15.9]|uniref:hypothetical protein n=1 Tax=Tersicoccus mangrovi TaxID=3121635 RepID=UPI002FE50758